MFYSKEDLNNTGIYAICNRVNDKVYVGSTAKSFNCRWAKHVNELNKGIHHSKHLQAAWDKYGQENFDFMILEVVPKEEWKDDKYLLDVEQLWLDATQACDSSKGYNVCPTAGSSLGLKHTDESRKKMSEVKKGMVHSDETLQKMSESNKGKVRSDEARKRMMNAFKNRTPEHLKKISDSKCRYIYTLKSPESIGYTVRNLNVFCKENGLDIRNMCSVINGQRSHHKGWTGTRTVI